MKKKIFILLGVFIGFLALFYGINISQKTSIYISGSEIKNLINIWEDQTGRPPTNKEIDMIIKNLVNEEILYQEALKLGLNKNDKIANGITKGVQSGKDLSSDLGLEFVFLWKFMFLGLECFSYE